MFDNHITGNRNNWEGSPLTGQYSNNRIFPRKESPERAGSEQDRVPFEFLRPVEEIPVCGKLAAHKSIPHALCNIDHLWIEIPDPLHFVFRIYFQRLDDLGRLGN